MFILLLFLLSSDSVRENSTFYNLQIQLEKIRQAETEVRWQHEDDVEECNNCKQSFSVTRRKVSKVRQLVCDFIYINNIASLVLEVW